MSFFIFSKKELTGILVLFILMLTYLFMPYLYNELVPRQVTDFAEFESEIAAFKASLIADSNYSDADNTLRDDGSRKASYFFFDPNEIPFSSWRQLGLSEKQAQVIINYRGKGGRFYRKEDLKKIYSIRKAQYALLEPWIRITDDAGSRPEKSVVSEKRPAGLRKTIQVELNSADSVLLDSVRGIGPSLASRIIKYRNRLGGFIRIDQLAEVYGIDSARFAELKGQLHVEASMIRQIKINSVVFEDLRNFPYLTYRQMNAIIAYRKQHGPFLSIADLEKIVLLDKVTLDRIAPYLSF